MKATKEQKKIIEAEISKKYGSMKEAKKIVKDLSDRYMNHLKEHKRLFGHLKRITAKSNNFFFQIRESSCYVDINGVDKFFYCPNPHFSNASGTGGVGYYVLIRTRCGVMPYKLSEK